MEVPIGNPALLTQHQIGTHRQHERRQAMQITDGPSLSRVRKSAQIRLANAQDRDHHLFPVRAHGLERRDIHRTLVLIPTAGVRAGAPLGRHVQPQFFWKHIALTDLPPFAIERDVRNAIERQHQLQITQLQGTTARQLWNESFGFDPGARY